MGLDTVELIMHTEDYFEIQIPDNEAENIATVQQLIDYIFDKINLKPIEVVLSKDEIFIIICGFIEKITGLPQNKIKKQDTFTNDLDMD